MLYNLNFIEEEAEETQEQIITGPKAGCYQIVGTLRDPDAKKPDFVKEIFQVSVEKKPRDHL